MVPFFEKPLVHHVRDFLHASFDRSSLANRHHPRMLHGATRRTYSFSPMVSLVTRAQWEHYLPGDAYSFQMAMERVLNE